MGLRGGVEFRAYGALVRALIQLLGGSWVVICGVTSRVTIILSHIRGLITLLITTHEPTSRPLRDPPRLGHEGPLHGWRKSHPPRLCALENQPSGRILQQKCWKRALIFRIGFWGPFYSDYHKEPPQ